MVNLMSKSCELIIECDKRKFNSEMDKFKNTSLRLEGYTAYSKTLDCKIKETRLAVLNLAHSILKAVFNLVTWRKNKK